jgi:hypothetical protein
MLSEGRVLEGTTDSHGDDYSQMTVATAIWTSYCCRSPWNPHWSKALPPNLCSVDVLPIALVPDLDDRPIEIHSGLVATIREMMLWELTASTVDTDSVLALVVENL